MDMTPTQRRVYLLLSTFLLSGAGCAPQLEPVPGSVDVTPPRNHGSAGCWCIPFEITVTGHPLVRVHCGERELRMILDTASGANVLTPDAAKALDIAPQRGEKAGGAAGLGTQTHAFTPLSPVRLSYGENSFVVDDLVALDLTHVKQAGGDEGLDGLLGFPFFRKYRATIDFARNELSFALLDNLNTK